MKTIHRLLLLLLAACAQLHGQNFTQNVNISSSATTTPNLSVSGAGGVVFGGTYGVGSIPSTSSGNSELMWYPAKGAFRAGYNSPGVWDDSNIGGVSVGLGGNPVASGYNSVALGAGTAVGDNSIAAGWGCYSYGLDSFSTAYATASAAFSFAAQEATASGYESVALQGGLAIGNHSVAIGNYVTSMAVQSVVVGQFNELIGDPVAASSADPIFVVGTGTGTAAGQQQNGFSVLRDGTVRMAKRQGNIQMGAYGLGNGD